MTRAIVLALLAIGCGGGDNRAAVANRMPLEGPVVDAAHRATGTACAYNTQCASGACSAEANGCGRCLELRAIGERCDGPDQRCANRAAYPDEAACIRGVCTSTYTQGHACSVPEKSLDHIGPCAEGLYCAGSCEAITRTIPVGGACDPNRLTSEFCAKGSSCSSDSVCVIDAPRPPVATATPHAFPGEGETCDDYHCAAELYCFRAHDNADPVDHGRCTRRVSMGQTCAASGIEHDPCAAGLECRGGTCQSACR